MIKDNLECPVDLIMINEKKVRLTAAGIFILAVSYLFTGFWPIPIFLVIDFILRAYKLGRYSLLNAISGRLVKIFKITPKPIDQAPKRFAAKIGLAFSISIVFFVLLQLKTPALITAGIIALFALLESAAGFCAGCHAYTLYSKIAKKKVALY